MHVALDTAAAAGLHTDSTELHIRVFYNARAIVARGGVVGSRGGCSMQTVGRHGCMRDVLGCRQAHAWLRVERPPVLQQALSQGGKAS
jgi:hypothetical protein